MNTKTKNRGLFAIISAVCVLLAVGITVSLGLLVSSATESGTAGNPIEIGTAEELRAFAARVNDGERTLCAKLTADIDLGSSAWTPIGTSDTAAYSGVFNGNGHTVSGMSITATSDYKGFFGVINGSSSRILDLTVSGEITVKSTSQIKAFGGIAGMIDGGASVKRCTSRVNITMDSTSTATAQYIGGVCGWGKNSAFDGCTYSGTINIRNKNVDCIGGIVAYTNGAITIKNCAFFGEIKSTTTTDLQTGGILGYVNNSAFGGMQSCYSNGNISYGSSLYIKYRSVWAR